MKSARWFFFGIILLLFFSGSGTAQPEENQFDYPTTPDKRPQKPNAKSTVKSLTSDSDFSSSSTSDHFSDTESIGSPEEEKALSPIAVPELGEEKSWDARYTEGVNELSETKFCDLSQILYQSGAENLS